jgi:hypothetical protein
MAGLVSVGHESPAWQLTDATRTVLSDATEHAAAPARALTATQDLTATLHAAEPALAA